MRVEKRMHDFAQPRPLARVQAQRLDGRIGNVDAVLPEMRLDFLDDFLRFLLAIVRNEPAWALRHPHPHEKDRESKHRADQEARAVLGLTILFMRMWVPE